MVLPDKHLTGYGDDNEPSEAPETPPEPQPDPALNDVAFRRREAWLRLAPRRVKAIIVAIGRLREMTAGRRYTPTEHEVNEMLDRLRREMTLLEDAYTAKLEQLSGAKKTHFRFTAPPLSETDRADT